MKRIIVTFLLVVPVFLLSVSWTVRHDGTGDFETIQTAIDTTALAAGDSIIVWSCIDSVEHYYESLVISRDIPFTLCSQRNGSGDYLTDNTYICGNGIDSDIINFMRSEIDTASIFVAGFTITHLDSVFGRGIMIAGGDSLTTSEVSIEYCDIRNNGDPENNLSGGGIRVESGVESETEGLISIANCEVKYNLARIGAGISLYNISDEIRIENTTIIENTVNDSSFGYGGGIAIENTLASTPQKITIANSTIASNYGGLTGGGIYTQYELASMSFIECQISDNLAESGGGLKFIQSGTITTDGIKILNCEILNNTVTTQDSILLSNGGGIEVLDSNISIENTLIDSNYARTDGGGIYLISNNSSNGCNLEMVDSQVSNNVAEGYGCPFPSGGGIKGGNCHVVRMANVEIINNEHTCGSGGGFAIGGGTETSTIEFDACEIRDNEAPGGGAGGIVGSFYSLIMEDTVISGNSGFNSGIGISLGNVANSIDINNCEFIDNVSNGGEISTDAAGGGLFMLDCGQYNISDCIFTGNSNEGGSAISIDSDDLNIGYFNNLLIADNFQSNNVAADTTYLGAIALVKNQDIRIENCTICNNISDTTVTGCGGIDLGDETDSLFVNIKECIFWNNSGDEVDAVIPTGNITYCDIEDYPYTSNHCFNEDPIFDNEETYELHWRSPCIDAGDATESDPEGSIPDLGYKFYEQDVLGWDYTQGERIVWEWRCFPKLMIVDSLNTGQSIHPDSVLTNWNPRPDSIFVQHELEEDWLLGEWDDVYEWIWDPVNNRNINSPLGLKIAKDSLCCKLFYRGALSDPDVKMVLDRTGENWVGYFLENSQNVKDAIPEDVIDDLVLIKTWRWSMSRPSSGQPWVYPPKYTLNYGDLVILGTERDTVFTWNQHRGGEPVYRPMAEHYEYEEKSDYLPFYTILDPENLPEEIAIFIDGVCKGAEKVDADTTQICGYILDEPPGEEIEFEFWYGSRKPAVRHKSYLVHDPVDKEVFSNSIVTGMNDDFYLVSFYADDEIPPAEIQMCCYPNPFNPSLNIAFNVAEETEIEINIYNIKGQKVKTLASELFRTGEYELVWNGRNEQDKQTGSGVYFIRMKAGSKNLYRKVVMLK
ncbi:MAG: T9SS type A sorting domain-containing protein [Candidatus Cloacimonetes bacterium]|nr:T9SS type A sorting domain-containing protein [Candidatus Cloacimonadota bacterium]